MSFLNIESEKFGLKFSDLQLKQFEIYKNYMLEYNQHTNLTSIKNSEDVDIKHFLDSVAFCKFIKFKEDAKIIDIGTGAGFPGVPLKIFKPSIDLTLVDSLNKRITFLKNLALKLGINVNAIHARAEELGNNLKYREKFDYAVSRAVAPLNILVEYDLPYVKVGGYFIALKGPEISEEIKNASKAISTLGGVLEAKFEFDLPLEKGRRTIVIIKKKSSTPKIYPRKNSKITSITL